MKKWTWKLNFFIKIPTFFLPKNVLVLKTLLIFAQKMYISW